jgi:hypothetical protein
VVFDDGDGSGDGGGGDGGGVFSNRGVITLDIPKSIIIGID